MKKRYVLAGILFIILLTVIGGIFLLGEFYTGNEKLPVTKKDVAGNYDIPKMYIVYEDYKINELTGYTVDMQLSCMKEMVTPIKDDTINLKIVSKDVTVKKINYEIRAIDDGRLIDEKEIDSFSQKKNTISLELECTTLIESDVEYMLCVELLTEELDVVSYYTGIIKLSGDFLTKQLDFAMNISESTFDYKKAKDYVAYLEVDDTANNDNLGVVTINSNFDQFTWGELGPEKSTDTAIAVKDLQIDGEKEAQTGTYEFSYKVKAKDDDNEITYSVKEEYVVWTYMNTNYLLDYQRTVDEDFVASSRTITKSGVNLGIQSDDDISIAESEDKEKITFVVSNALYYMDLSQGKIVKVYACDDKMVGKSDIQEIAISDEGIVEFIVYGYMGNGKHTGENGVGAFAYDSQKDTLEEILFIRYEKPYEYLKQQIGELYYISDEVLYILVDSSLYYINLVTKECGISIDGLEPGTYVVNSKRNILAYNTNGTLYDSDTISIVSLKDGATQVIDAVENCRMRVLGFINDDIVYGVAKLKNISVKKSKKSTFNMTYVNIMSIDGEIIKHYKQSRMLISDVEISDTMINLSRVKNGEATDNDQILYNVEKGTNIAEVSIKNYDNKKNQVFLKFANSWSAMSKADIMEVIDINYSDTVKIEFKAQDLQK